MLRKISFFSEKGDPGFPVPRTISTKQQICKWILASREDIGNYSAIMRAKSGILAVLSCISARVSNLKNAIPAL